MTLIEHRCQPIDSLNIRRITEGPLTRLAEAKLRESLNFRKSL